MKMVDLTGGSGMIAWELGLFWVVDKFVSRCSETSSEFACFCTLYFGRNILVVRKMLYTSQPIT